MKTKEHKRKEWLVYCRLSSSPLSFTQWRKRRRRGESFISILYSKKWNTKERFKQKTILLPREEAYILQLKKQGYNKSDIKTITKWSPYIITRTLNNEN